MPEPSKRPVKESPKVLEISGDAVCQTSFEVCPYKFIRIKLRRVSREMKGMDSRVFSKEFMDELGPVERTSVPEKDDRSLEVSTKMPEELPDLSSPNVFVGVETRVESKTLFLGRDSNGGDSRYFCPSSGDNERWSSSFDRPSSLNIGDKRKSALIQEGQAGSKPDGLFLYAAKRDVSSSESLLPDAPWLSSAASDNSSPERSSDSKDSLCNNAPGNSSEESDQCASASKDLSSNRLPRGLSLRRTPRIFSDGLTKTRAVPYSASTLGPCGPSSCSFDASAPRRRAARA